MEARALHDYVAQSSDELSFRQGDFLNLIDLVNFLISYFNRNFYFLANKQSWIPRTYWLYSRKLRRANGEYILLFFAFYQRLKPNHWYHGDIPRQHAEQILSRQDLPRGAFLIRASEKSGGPGAFSLSVKNTSHRNLAEHYRILKNQRKKTFWLSRSFLTGRQWLSFFRGTVSSLVRNLLQPKSTCPSSHAAFSEQRYKPGTRWYWFQTASSSRDISW